MWLLHHTEELIFCNTESKVYTATKFNSDTLLAAVALANWEGVPAQWYCKFGIFDVRQIIIDYVHGMWVNYICDRCENT